MANVIGTEVRERRSARWARFWVSSRPLGAEEKRADTNTHRRDDEIERVVSEDVYGLCPGWWIPAFLILALVWLGVMAWVAVKWAI
jgi:hypothetical protein